LGVTFRDQAAACTALHCLAKSKGGAVASKQLLVELVGESEEEVAHQGGAYSEVCPRAGGKFSLSADRYENCAICNNARRGKE
jgi:hypothetical protein